MDLQPSSKEKLRYEAATQARQFEIDLFWKRSLFFWGFQAAALVALAATHDKSPWLAVAVASFGSMCAWVWTLANRGSKYWYESWEKKLQSAEVMLTGPLFSEIEPEKDPEKWLSSKRYSVSRLAIGLSDYAVVFWLTLLSYEVASQWGCSVRPAVHTTLASLFVAGSVVYALVLRAKCAKHDPPRKPHT